MTSSQGWSAPHIILDQFRKGLESKAFRNAIRDIWEAWGRRELWATIALQDVRQRYRRSTLGPFWITISMGVMVFAMGLLYGQIFGQDLHEYLPFLSAGFVIWALVSTLILEGCTTFISAEGMIRQVTAPTAIYAYRGVSSALIAFSHNIWIFFIVAWWYDLGVTWNLLWLIPAILILLINGLWLALFFGLLSARFRDVPLIVASIVQVLFFLTPVIWRPEMLPERSWFLNLNPCYHMVEILRAPLLGQAPTVENWVAVALVASIGWSITLIFYSTYRWRIPYWV